MLSFSAGKHELRASALAELTAALSRDDCSWAHVMQLLRLCPELPKLPKEYLDAIHTILAAAAEESDLQYHAVSSIDQAEFGHSPLDESSESAALAVIQFMGASKGVHLERLLPFAMRLLFALPFFRWSHQHRQRAESFSHKLVTALTEMAVVLPIARRPVLRCIVLLHRQCSHMTRQLPDLRPFLVTVDESNSRWLFEADSPLPMPTSHTLLQAPHVLLGMMRSFSQFAPPCGRFSINELMGDLDLLLHFLIGSTDNDTKRAAAFGFLASKEATTLVIAALQAYAALLSSPAVGPLTAAARIQRLWTLSIGCVAFSDQTIQFVFDSPCTQSGGSNGMPVDLVVSAVRLLSRLGTAQMPKGSPHMQIVDVLAATMHSMINRLLVYVFESEVEQINRACCIARAAIAALTELALCYEEVAASLVGSDAASIESQGALVQLLLSYQLQQCCEESDEKLLARLSVRDDCLASLGTLLRREVHGQGVSFESTRARALLAGLSSSLFASHIETNQDATFTVAQQRQLWLLTRAVMLLDFSPALDLVQPLLIDRMSSQSNNQTAVLSVVLPHLSEVALLTQREESFAECLSHVISAFRSEFMTLVSRDSNMNIVKWADQIIEPSSPFVLLGNALSRWARGIHHESPRRLILRNQLMSLFVDLCSEFHLSLARAASTSSSGLRHSSTIAAFSGASSVDLTTSLASVIGPLGLIFGVLADALSTSTSSQSDVLNAPKAHGSSDSDLFRDLWYYAVLFEFVIVDGARASKVAPWTGVWADSARRIAIATPPLLHHVNDSGSACWLDDINARWAVRQGAPAATISLLRAQLVSLLPASSAASESVHSLPLGTLVHLLCMHHVETMRVLNGCFAPVMTCVSELNGDSPDAQLARDIAVALFDRVFTRFIAPVVAESEQHGPVGSVEVEPRLHSVEQHAMLLITHLTSRHERVRQVARHWLIKLLKHVPSVLHSQRALLLLLDTAQRLFRLVSESDDAFAAEVASVQLSAHLSLDFPDDRVTRAALLAQLMSVSLYWMNSKTMHVRRHRCDAYDVDSTSASHEAQSAALEALLSQLAVRAQLHEARQLSPHAISLPARFHSFAQPMQVTHVGALLAHGADLNADLIALLSKFDALSTPAVTSPFALPKVSVSSLLQGSVATVQVQHASSNTEINALLAAFNGHMPPNALLQSIALHQQYLGEIRGLLAAFQRQQRHERWHPHAHMHTHVALTAALQVWAPTRSIDPSQTMPDMRPLTFGEHMQAELNDELQTLTAQFKSLQHGATAKSTKALNWTQWVQRFEGFVLRSAALLVWSRGGDDMESERHSVDAQAVVHLIGQSVGLLGGRGSAAIIRVVCDAWSWLLHCDQHDHSLQLMVLQDIHAALSHCVDAHTGLFSAHGVSQKEDSIVTRTLPRSAHALNSDADPIAAAHATAELEASREAVDAQCQWIRFLHAHCAALAPTAPQLALLFERMAQVALSAPERILSTPQAAAARFALIHFAGSVVELRRRQLHQCHDQHDVQRASIDLLRHRWQVAVMSWFSLAPRWVDHRMQSDMHEYVASLMGVLRCVEREDLAAASNWKQHRKERSVHRNKVAIPLAEQSDQSLKMADSSFCMSHIDASVVLKAHRFDNACPRIDLEIATLLGKPFIALLSLLPSRRSLTVPHDQAAAGALNLKRLNTMAALQLTLSDASSELNSTTETVDINSTLGAASLSVWRLLCQVPQSDQSEAAFVHARRDWCLRRAILLLVTHEIDRLTAWHNPTGDAARHVTAAFGNSSTALSVSLLESTPALERESLFNAMWEHDAKLGVRLVERFPAEPAFTRLLNQKALANPMSIYHAPIALWYILVPLAELDVTQQAAACTVLRTHLGQIDACPLPLAMALLASPVLAADKSVNAYAIRSLRAHTIEAVVFYLPQLVQMLRSDKFGMLPAFLAEAARTSCMLAHRLIWLCETESVQDPDKHGQYPPKDPLTDIVVDMRQRIVAQMDAAQQAFFQAEFTFFEQVTAISGVLKPLPTKASRRARIAEEARKINVLQGLYLPTSPAWQVESILVDSGIPLQSAAKVPILLAFTCRRLNVLPHHPPEPYSSLVESAVEAADNVSIPDSTASVSEYSGSDKPLTAMAKADTPSLFKQACIFKVNDDIRQDVLSLQLIQMCKQIFELHGLELWLRPYRVIANRSGADKTIGGIIECVPNAASRAEMGQANGMSLKQHFINKYGTPDSAAFRRAQRNFILSVAGSSVATYILQVKDRHNGNVMITDEGHLLHIDFGFIFETSPGANMRFESANFKLTEEMVELIGDGDSYRWFVDLVVRGFLAVREHYMDILSAVALMSHSGLPCFRPNCMKNLRARFFPDMSERDAASEMLKVIADANCKWTTGGYDAIQWQQQAIWYWKPGAK